MTVAERELGEIAALNAVGRNGRCAAA